MRAKFSFVLLMVLLFASSGCQHTHLKYNAVRQAGTLSEIFEQQVLDNLAMFVHDPHSLPYFAYPGDGTTALTDSAAFSADPVRDFWSVLAIEGSREGLEQWGLVPVCEPDKLALMQSAYQQAIYGQKLDPCNTESRDGECPVECGWLCRGCRKDVPRDCCLLVGEHCGTYVWVQPQYRHHLTRLTLKILDYSLNDEPAPREKRVVLTVDVHGNPTADRNLIVGTVESVLEIEAPIQTLLMKNGTGESAPSPVDPTNESSISETPMDSVPPSEYLYEPKKRTERPTDFGINPRMIQRQQRALQP